MSAQRIWLIAWIALGLGASLAAAQNPLPAASSVPAPVDVRPFVAAIEAADSAEAAANAYDRGSAADRGNLEVNRAYMKKMLKLGQPQIAWYPAQIVLGRDPNDALALGVAGYFYATHNNFSNALVNSVCASGLAPDNEGILHNAGLLVAWYDFDPSVGPVPYAGRCSLQRLRDRLQANSVFHTAYEQAHQNILARQQKVDALSEEIRATEPQLDELRSKAFELDGKMRETASNLRFKQMLQPNVDYYRRNYPWLPFGKPSDNSQNYYGYGLRYPYPFLYRPDPLGNDLYQQQAINEIDRLSEDIRTLGDRYQGLSQQATTLLGELRLRQGHLNDLRRQRDELFASKENVYTFIPPAVDGEVVPPAPAVSLASRPAINDPEVEAQYRLDLAKLFLNNNMPPRAISTLKDMLASYPNTKAAAEARLLLEELKP